jgi:hypothetical protein
VFPFFVFPIWLSIEFYVVAISGLVVLFTWRATPASRYRARWARWGWFWVITAR